VATQIPIPFAFLVALCKKLGVDGQIMGVTLKCGGDKAAMLSLDVLLTPEQAEALTGVKLPIVASSVMDGEAEIAKWNASIASESPAVLVKK